MLAARHCDSTTLMANGPEFADAVSGLAEISAKTWAWAATSFCGWRTGAAAGGGAFVLVPGRTAFTVPFSNWREELSRPFAAEEIHAEASAQFRKIGTAASAFRTLTRTSMYTFCPPFSNRCCRRRRMRHPACAIRSSRCSRCPSGLLRFRALRRSGALRAFRARFRRWLPHTSALDRRSLACATALLTCVTWPPCWRA